MWHQNIIILISALFCVKFEPYSAISVKRYDVSDVETVKESLTVASKDETNIVKDIEGRNKIPIQKCCPIDQYVIAYNSTCGRAKRTLNRNFSEVPLYDKSRFITGRVLPDVYTLEPGRFNNETFYKGHPFNYIRQLHKIFLTEEGMLYQQIPNDYYGLYEVDSDNFCVDYELPNKFHRNLQVGFWTIVKKNEEILPSPISIILILSGLMVSSVFLVMVLLVYCLLPELRNLGGLVLMAYVTCLLVAFVTLTSIIIGDFSRIACQLLTFIIYFFFLASFCWMNVMSYDIWWTFRGYAKARPIHRRGERFKFLMYCAYAFGLPLAMTIMLVVINSINMKHIPWFVTPNIPNNACFIAETSKRFYLYIPMLILIILNWVFFMMTAFNVWRLNRGTAVLDSAAGTPAAHRKQRARLMVYLKLSIIMGINWVMEVVSSFKPNLKVWLLTDMYNILIGVSIFFIFVFKKKIFRKLTKKFHDWYEPRRTSRYSKSRSSNTTESDASQDTPLQVCPDPKGPIYVVRAQK